MGVSVPSFFEHFADTPHRLTVVLHSMNMSASMEILVRDLHCQW